MDFPQLFRNEDGVELIANNDIQASAFINGGFKPAGEYVENDEQAPRKGRPPKQQ